MPFAGCHRSVCDPQPVPITAEFNRRSFDEASRMLSRRAQHEARTEICGCAHKSGWIHVSTPSISSVAIWYHIATEHIDGVAIWYRKEEVELVIRPVLCDYIKLFDSSMRDFSC